MADDTRNDAEACGLAGLLVTGLGSMIGGGVFAAAGPLVNEAGAAAPLAFVIGAFPAWLTAFTYGRLALRNPSFGGSVACFNAALGGGYLSASFNLLLLVCYIGVASLYAGVFGVYSAHILGLDGEWAIRVFSCSGIAFVAYANISSAGWMRKLQGRLVFGKFLVMFVFVIAALNAPTWNWSHFSREHWPSVASAAAAGMSIFMNFQGFELMASTHRAIRTPERTIPLALGGCLLFASLYYGVIAFCVVGNVNYATAAAESPYLLSVVAGSFMGQGGELLLCLGAVLASLSALNADVLSVSPVPENMAEKGELPSYFASSRPGAQALGVFFFCGAMILFVNLVSVPEMMSITGVGFLVIYAAVNFLGLKIAPVKGYRRNVAVLGGCVCLAAAAAVVYRLADGGRNIRAVWITLALLLCPFVWQAVYYAVARAFFRKHGG